VLAVVVHGCAVPLLWKVLPNPGASDTTERQDLVEQFLRLFGRGRLRFVTRIASSSAAVDWLVAEGKGAVPYSDQSG
jgi:hypothetical protein